MVAGRRGRGLKRREEDVPTGRAERPIGLEEEVGVPVELALAPATTPLGQWERACRRKRFWHCSLGSHGTLDPPRLTGATFYPICGAICSLPSPSHEVSRSTRKLEHDGLLETVPGEEGCRGKVGPVRRAREVLCL